MSGSQAGAEAQAQDRRSVLPDLLHLTPRTVILLVGGFGAALAMFRLLEASQRVLGWMAAAATVAGLLHPTVVYLSRHLPRGLAVLLVVIVTLGTTGAVIYSVADDVVGEGRRLQRAIPRRAAQLESEGRFREAASEIRLAERAKSLMDDLPQRLQGGTQADAIRAAATRGVAFLATGVFTLFLLLHGPRLARAAVDQVHNEERRLRFATVGVAAYRRGFAYARGSLAMSILSGLVAYVACVAADVPGPAALALWVAVWDIVPLVGALLGSIPLIVLAGAQSPKAAALVALTFVILQVVEALFLQRLVERDSVRLGPFLTLLGLAAGLEAYGFGGAVLTVLGIAVLVAAADELTPAPTTDPQPP